MKNSIILFISALFIFSSCKEDPKKPLRQEDLPIHQDTSVTVNQIKIASDSLNNFIAENPRNIEALIARSNLYLENKNLKYAYADAAAAMEIDSLNADVLLTWGNVNYVINKTRISKTAWEKCIKIDAKSIDCRLKLAELYNIVQDFRKSLKLVNEVLDIDPNQPIALFIKGINVRDINGDTASSMQYFQRAIDLDNNYIAALDMMGVMLSAQKDPLALAYFNRILEINPNSHSTYYNMGMYYLSIEDWNNAIKAFTNCTQLQPKDIESYFNLGYIHLQLNINDVARDYFTQALKIQPINHRALYGRAYAYERLGDIINAEKDYKEALSYNPQHEASKIGLKRILDMK